MLERFPVPLSLFRLPRHEGRSSEETSMTDPPPEEPLEVETSRDAEDVEEEESTGRGNPSSDRPDERDEQQLRRKNRGVTDRISEEINRRTAQSGNEDAR